MARLRHLLAGTVTLALAGIAPATLAPPAAAAPQVSPDVITLTAEPGPITQGPDGNMWVSLSGSQDDLAMITPAGTVTYYDVPGVNGLGSLTPADGRLWATLSTGVLEIPVADPTTATAHAIGGFTDARGIDLGPDGNLWAASGDKVFRIPLDAPTTADDFTVPGMGAREVAASADRVWVVDNAGARVLAFEVDGTYVEHAVGGSPQGIAAGPGGQVLYTNPENGAHHAARLALGGAPQKTPLPDTDPSFSVAVGRDGSYWVGLFLTFEVARITPSGQKDELGTFPAPYRPRYLAAGPGGTVWVSLQDPGNPGAIGRVTGLAKPDTTATVRLASKRVAVSGGKARVRLTWPKAEVNGPCRGRVTLRALSGGKKPLGTRTYAAGRGRTVAVAVPLSRATVGRIGRAGLRVRAVIVVRDGAGNARTLRTTVRLVR